MTLRLPLLSLALAAAGLAGCEGAADGGTAGTADLSGIAEADAFEQFSYNAGYQSGQQFLAQDSSFSFERFRDGLNDGLSGDSSAIGYALGLQYGLQLRQDTVANIDPEIFLAGVREGLEGAELRISEDQLGRVQAAVEDSIRIRQIRGQAQSNPRAQEQLRLISRNAASADSFLAAVRSREGIEETASGVLYTVDEAGDGATPSLTDRVAINYVGRFANGQIFDQSGDEPAVLPVRAVVPGFQEALLDMQVGETRTVYLPPSQAYGLSGSPGPGGQGGIPPNAALEFTITLLDIQQGQPQGATGALPGQ